MQRLTFVDVVVVVVVISNQSPTKLSSKQLSSFTFVVIFVGGFRSFSALADVVVGTDWIFSTSSADFGSCKRPLIVLFNIAEQKHAHRETHNL